MKPLIFFKLTINGPVAHLSLNRPEKANCMEPVFWTELPEVIQELDQTPSVRVLVISGEGKHFSAGMDMSSFNGIYEILKSEAARASFALRDEILRLQATFNALENARFPVIAAIHGACVGGALSMVAACDIRISAADAKFSIEEANIGMTADLGTLQRLPKLMALGIVKELALTGRRFTAEEAKNWGFVNSVYDDKEQTIAAGLSLAKQIASKSPLVSAGVKYTLDYTRDHSVSESLTQIASWNAGMLRREDMEKSITAKMKREEALYEDLVKTEPFAFNPES